jgi:hypothetical protein
MQLRAITLTACAVDLVVWAIVAYATFLSGSDAATRGLDRSAGMLVTGLFLATAVPAFALTRRGRAPITALVLALAFPLAFAIAFVVAVVAFA